MTCRGWCGTAFNLEALAFPEEANEEIKFLIWQLESCPDTGRVHAQFYVEFHNAVRYSAAQRISGDLVCHVEARRGTPKQAADYCRKSTSALTRASECGDLPAGPGSRTDLDQVQEALQQGTPPQEIASLYFSTWARYYRAIDRYWLEHQPSRDWEMDVRVYFGEPNTGKSRRAFSEANGRPYVLSHSNGGVWFDGYAGQDTVIVDDFYGWLPWSFLLQFLDRYEFRVPIKGAHVPFISKTIIFTSNTHPSDWYDFVSKPHMVYAALARRINKCEEMTL